MDIARRRVLLVDGHADTVDSLAMLLDLYGHEVERCYDGAGVLDAALRFQPDLVILEQRLPGLQDGMTLGRALTADPRLAGVSVAMQTATARPGDPARARDSGFVEYMLKPIEPDDILALVERVPSRCCHALPA